MCGIAGILNIKAQTKELRDKALKMAQKIRHRGLEWYLCRWKCDFGTRTPFNCRPAKWRAAFVLSRPETSTCRKR